MRKVFIGCGVLVLVVLGAIGWFTYKLYPVGKRLVERSNAAIVRLNDLQKLHPFDPATATHLDTERFVRALQLRADFGDYLRRTGDTLESMKLRAEEGEAGFGMFEQIGAAFSVFGDALTEFADRLDAAGMSWPEYAFYTRTMWGVLYRLDQLNIADPGLEPLRGAFNEYKLVYERETRGAHDAPKLTDLVTNIPPGVLSAAEQVMVANLPLVRQGLGTTEIDHVLMSPVVSLDELGAVHVKKRDDR